jgi:hypothetical protein
MPWSNGRLTSFDVATVCFLLSGRPACVNREVLLNWIGATSERASILLVELSAEMPCSKERLTSFDVAAVCCLLSCRRCLTGTLAKKLYQWRCAESNKSCEWANEHRSRSERGVAAILWKNYLFQCFCCSFPFFLVGVWMGLWWLKLYEWRDAKSNQ